MQEIWQRGSGYVARFIGRRGTFMKEGKMALATRKKREGEMVMHGGGHVWITHGSSNNITCMNHTMPMKRMMKCNMTRSITATLR